jgi:SAM-dependent methyltransferase
VTERLFAAANVAAGQRVLDVGAGGGDTALLAAERVSPQGLVLATDTSLEAMGGLLQRIRELPRTLPITVQAVAAESLALEPESFDVAIARNSVMYFSELLRALGNVRAALRPGGRFVASVYGPMEREPFHSIPVAAVRRRCEVRAPFPEYVQAFCVDAGQVERGLIDAGFRRVERDLVPTRRSFPSLESAIEALHHSRSLAQLLSCLPDGQRADAWGDIAAGFRDFESTSGLCLPGEQVVLVGTA